MKRAKIKGMVAKTDYKHRGPGRPPLPPESRLRRRITLLSPDQIQRLREASQVLGISEAAFIRGALDRELELAGVS